VLNARADELFVCAMCQQRHRTHCPGDKHTINARLELFQPQ
jgi:hypothetical protein